MHLLNAKQYFQALLEGIPKTNRRIVIHAMIVSWGPYTKALVPLLAAAGKRGVDIQIVGDRFTKFQANLPRFSRPKYSPWSYTATINAQLEENGATCAYIGKVGLNPYKHRTHSKITILDDRIFTFGGVNFSDDSFENHDYMLDMHDPILADRLYRLVMAIKKDDRSVLADLDEQLGGQATLLFDGGAPGKSVIYDTACQVVSTAKKVYYVSQMCPSGKLAKNIRATDNECYFITPSQAEPPANLALVLDTLRYKITNRYHGKTYIHAKFILTEDKNGSKHIISGSNNFSWRGIAYGTREIAVHSTDTKLWDAFYGFLQQNIKND